jgi:FixJ family two-component response regulator
MPSPDELPTVLVVDDEEEVLELLGEYLRARGYGLRTAYDGESALEIIRSGGVDIVLSDLKMPHMGGLELLKQVQAHAQPVAVILMSGFATVESAIGALKAGAYDFLRKPFKLRDVHDALTQSTARLAEAREASRRRDLLAFYEQAHGLDDLDGLPRFYGTLASVARQEARADEVAVWLVGAGGWEPVARGGRVQALRRVDVGQVTDTPDLSAEGGVLAIPLRLGGRRIGALAVAGGGARRAEQCARLRRLGRALTDTLARIDWRPDR